MVFFPLCDIVPDASLFVLEKDFKTCFISRYTCAVASFSTDFTSSLKLGSKLYFLGSIHVGSYHSAIYKELENLQNSKFGSLYRQCSV